MLEVKMGTEGYSDGSDDDTHDLDNDDDSTHVWSFLFWILEKKNKNILSCAGNNGHHRNTTKKLDATTTSRNLKRT